MNKSHNNDPMLKEYVHEREIVSKESILETLKGKVVSLEIKKIRKQDIKQQIKDKRKELNGIRNQELRKLEISSKEQELLQVEKEIRINKKEVTDLKYLIHLMEENNLNSTLKDYYDMYFNFRKSKYPKSEFDDLLNKLSSLTIDHGYCPISDYLKDETWSLVGLGATLVIKGEENPNNK